MNVTRYGLFCLTLSKGGNPSDGRRPPGLGCKAGGVRSQLGLKGSLRAPSRAGAYPGFSEGGGGQDPPKKLTSQRSARLS